MQGDETPVSLAAVAVVIAIALVLLTYLYINRDAITSNVAPLIQEASEVSQEQAESTESSTSSRPKTAKQLKKQEAKEERRRLKQMQDEERKEKQERLEELKRIKEEKRNERIRAKELEEEKKRQAEREEYEAIAANFVVESQGEMAADAHSFSIEDLIQYIIWKKYCNVEDIAGIFALTPAQVVERIQELEAQGKIFGNLHLNTHNINPGILDERGRYLYIEESEMDALVAFIKRQGKVHKENDLVPFCNATFRLEPSTEHAKLLTEWEAKHSQLEASEA